jgi:phosphatidylglycerophosphate synthase
MNKVKSSAYDGNHNKIESILSPINHEIVNQNVKHIPGWIETYHLTSLTFIWTIVVLFGAILSKYTLQAVWICLLALVGHIITDAFDGALGRYRKTGLVRWGYYMDHFGDYLLSCALIISFKLIEPRVNEYLIFFLLVVITGYFIHSLLSTVTLNKFTLTFFKLFSPLEGQIAYVFIYILVLLFDQRILLLTIPLMGIIATVGLGYLVWITTRSLWKMEITAQRRKKSRVDF